MHKVHFSIEPSFKFRFYDLKSNSQNVCCCFLMRDMTKSSSRLLFGSWVVLGNCVSTAVHTEFKLVSLFLIALFTTAEQLFVPSIKTGATCSFPVSFTYRDVVVKFRSEVMVLFGNTNISFIYVDCFTYSIILTLEQHNWHQPVKYCQVAPCIRNANR